MIKVRSAGDAALLVETLPVAGQRPQAERPAPAGDQGGNGAAGIAAAIRAADLRGIIDVVPGAATVLVSFEPGNWAAADLGRRLTELAESAGTAETAPAGTGTGATAEIKVVYDGPDLAEVAALTGLSVAEVIARHQAARYRVGWLGFSPGFGYLTGLDPLLAAVPRLDSPRLTVPAGSVAIAGGLAAVYPAASPGGWRLLGRTATALWDPDRDPPSLLAPGMGVRFRGVDQLPASTTVRDPAAAPARRPEICVAESSAGRLVQVLQPGPLTTIQDLGRAGLAHLGVPTSGAADAGSLRQANRLVGNRDGAACLEVTLGRLALRFDCDALVALTGAPAPIRLSAAGSRGADRGPVGGGQEPAHATAFTVRAGSLLRLGPPGTGLRSYLAIRGGIEVTPVLGSRSTDRLSGLGPEPLRPGDWLRVGQPRSRLKDPRESRLRAVGPARPGAPGPESTCPAPANQDSAGPVSARPVPASASPVSGGPVMLRAIAGPRADWFAAGALDVLAGGSYAVSAGSNRTGLRLTGPELRRRWPGELPSEGLAVGSLQVTHVGQPILLLADHPTTGGYPVIAVVVSADLGLAAQLRPGQQVRFAVSTG